MMEAGKLTLSPAFFNIAKMVHGMLAVCALARPAGGGTLVWAAEATEAPLLPAHVEADRRRILQCLQNICTNAMKFSSSPIRISVTLEPTAGDDDSAMLRIDVIDSGVGISADDLETIFGRCATADSGGAERPMLRARALMMRPCRLLSPLPATHTRLQRRAAERDSGCTSRACLRARWAATSPSSRSAVWVLPSLCAFSFG